MEKVEKQPPVPFVGFCDIRVVDADNIPRMVKGKHSEEPIHLTEDGDFVELVSEFSPDSPIQYFTLSGDRDDFLTMVWYTGPGKKADEPNRTNLIARVKGVKCTTLVKSAQDNLAKVKVEIPFVANRNEKLCDCHISLRTMQYEGKNVAKVTLRIPKQIFEESKIYQKALKAFDKDEKDEKEKEKDKKSDKSDKSEA
eukprot:Trichotokara_eunicae@DN4320_c0_g1_i1.p1